MTGNINLKQLGSIVDWILDIGKRGAGDPKTARRQQEGVIAHAVAFGAFSRQQILDEIKRRKMNVKDE